MVFVQKVQLCSAVVFPEVIIIFRCVIIFRIVVRVVPESGHRSKVVFVDYEKNWKRRKIKEVIYINAINPTKVIVKKGF